MNTEYLDKVPVEGRALDIAVPAKITQDVAIFLIHGGGWHSGSRQQYHRVMDKFIGQGFACASCDYRLVNDGYMILDQITDVRHAYDNFISHLKKCNRPLKVVVMGSSAGAHLAELISFSASGECGEKLDFKGRKLRNQWVTPVGVVPCFAPATFIPWKNINPDILKAMEKVAGGAYQEKTTLFKKISPDSYLHNIMMPVLFICAGKEHFFPVDMIEEMVEKVKAVNSHASVKIYPQTSHGFLYGVEHDSQKKAFKDILKFISTI